MGVWIEIEEMRKFASMCGVTPFVGVWIEISTNPILSIAIPPSLPSWECGLKYLDKADVDFRIVSLPSWECGLKFVDNSILYQAQNGHSLRGSVD